MPTLAGSNRPTVRHTSGWVLLRFRLGLALEFGLHKVKLSRTDVFYSMGPRVPPDRSAGFDLNHATRPIRERKLKLAVADEIDHVSRMRMHGDFLSWWDVHVQHANFSVIEYYFVGLRSSGHLHHVLRQGG